MNFKNSFVLFVHFLCLNKQNVKKCFLIYILHSENLYSLQNTTVTVNISKTVAKTCEKILMLSMNSNKFKSNYKVECRKFHSQLKSHITKQLFTSNLGRYKELSTLKRDIH